MTRKIVLAFPIACFMLLAFLLWRGLSLDPQHVPSALIGKPAPMFTMPTMDKKTLTKQDIVGQKTIINVWASWCVGCRQEHDTLMKIAASTDIPIIGFNYKDSAQDAKQFLSSRGNPFTTIAIDVTGRAMIDWGVYGAPETFLLDNQGHIVHKHVGPLTMQVWQSQFQPLIEKLA